MISVYNEFHHLTDPKLFTEDNKQKIRELTSIDGEFPLMFLGILSNFINNEPQYYFNRDVCNEVFTNFTHFYSQNPELFIQTLLSYQDNFFDSLNSYFNVRELYKELDSVAFDNELKMRLYYLPTIQQLMEYCLNSFYSGINHIINEFVDVDFSNANTLGSYKDNLKSKRLGDYTFDILTNIDYDFRNAISHGQVDVSEDKTTYWYREKGTREIRYSGYKVYELDSLKNNLIDIAGGAIIGWIKFILNSQLTESIFQGTAPEEIRFEFFKLLFQNDNIRISSFSKSMIDPPQLNIQIHIEEIDDNGSIIHLCILLLKAMYQFFPEYDRYFINYKHPFSISGMIHLGEDTLARIRNTSDLTTIDQLINHEASAWLLPEIQNYDPNYKAYKFQVFPKLKNSEWEVLEISDISNKDLKRYKCTLIIDNPSIEKDGIMSILLSLSKRIRQLENQKNPYTKIKFGKVEADVINLNVFYRQYERKAFSLLSDNEYFICSMYYYKNRSTPRIIVPFKQNYIFENIKKFDFYWNKNWKGNI
ncbi:hypothetical protein ACXWTF_11940 [Thiomicrolovo sp. ZZH C-3]